VLTGKKWKSDDSKLFEAGRLKWAGPEVKLLPGLNAAPNAVNASLYHGPIHKPPGGKYLFSRL
jgi:hypothetical protein